MPEIRFTEEDHAFAQEFVDRLESSGVAGTVREFLSKEDADWLLALAERDLRNNALMMRVAEAFVKVTVAAGLIEPVMAREAHYILHHDNLGRQREDEGWERRYPLEKQLPPNPNEEMGGSVLLGMLDEAHDEMRSRTGLNESETV
jgi:hypothetical protein